MNHTETLHLVAALASPPYQAQTPSAAQRLAGSALLEKIGFVRWERHCVRLHACEVAQSLLMLPSTAPNLRQLLRSFERSAWRKQRATIKEAVRERKSSVVLELRSANNQPITPLRVAVQMSFAADGTIVEFVLALQDIGPYTALAQALSDNQGLLREAQEVANLAYWEWNFLTRKSKLSPSARRFMNRAEDWDPNWHDIKELTPEDQRDRVWSMYKEAMEKRQTSLRYELHITASNGISSHVLTVANIDYSPTGRVERIVGTMHDVSEIKTYRRQLHSLAFFDPLTELPNRALFVERLGKACADSDWKDQQIGLLMLDIDRFKDINDSLGHSAGDLLLRQTAERLHQLLRGYDTVARLGGDEFAVVLPDVHTPDDMAGIAQKLLGAFNAPFTILGKEVFVSASVGGALYPTNASDVDQLLQFADAAMNDAKAKGRNNFQFYSPELTNKVVERISLERELRHAVERDELELFYQPKFDLATGTLVGAEALMRWNHPTRGMVPPDQFISLAEDTGLIVPMGEWALIEASRRTAQWNAHRAKALKVAVNLSTRQLSNNDFSRTVEKVLAATRCQPQWLELEITESLLLDGSDKVQAALQAIAGLGITIAIDDFGIGYSALSYLTRFPIHTLKIDRSFVKQIPGDRSSAELVKAIVSLAKVLNMQLVAEGVETPEQADYLKSLDCQLAQGYLFGKPMPAAQFEALMGKP